MIKSDSASEVFAFQIRGCSPRRVGFAHAVAVGAEVSSFDVGYTSQTEVFHTATAPGAPGTTTSSLVDLLRTTDTGMLTSYIPDGRASALEIKDGTFTAIYLDRREVIRGNVP